MPIRFTDIEIQNFIDERKPLPSDFLNRMRLKPKRGHNERELDIIGDEGHKFMIKLRQSQINVLDFSVILIVKPANTNTLFRLRRYNGKSHEHSNRIERISFYDFHIHLATERYQQLGLDEDAYAEITNKYSDIDGAMNYMIEDCRFYFPEGEQPNQTTLFN